MAFWLLRARRSDGVAHRLRVKRAGGEHHERLVAPGHRVIHDVLHHGLNLGRHSLDQPGSRIGHPVAILHPVNGDRGVAEETPGPGNEGQCVSIESVVDDARQVITTTAMAGGQPEVRHHLSGARQE